MPCGSTIDNSTRTLGSIPTSFPAGGWPWKIPVAWLAELARRWERHSQYGELLELDDRLLADIGVSREDVEEVRRSQLYRDAWRNSR